MLPRIGKAGGQQDQRSSLRAGSRLKTPNASRNGHGRATVELTDSEESSFGESDDSPVKPTRGPSAKYRAPVHGTSGGASPDPGLGMSRQQREKELLSQRDSTSRGERVDRSRVQLDMTKPVVRKEQVYSMRRQEPADISESTGEDSEGDATGRRVLNQVVTSKQQ